MKYGGMVASRRFAIRSIPDTIPLPVKCPDVLLPPADPADPLRAEQCEAYVFAHIDPVVAVKRRVPMTRRQYLTG